MRARVLALFLTLAVSGLGGGCISSAARSQARDSWRRGGPYKGTRMALSEFATDPVARILILCFPPLLADFFISAAVDTALLPYDSVMPWVDRWRR